VRHRSTALIAVCAAIAIAVTACSADTSTTTPASGGSTGASSAGVEAAKAATAKNKVEPKAIPQTVPLKSKPETGKTFVWLKCADVNQCSDLADGFKEAIAAIGWDYKELSYKSADPATLVTALKQALDFKPTAVGLTGLPRAVWESVVPDYKAAGVKIVTGYLGPTQYDETVIGQVGGPKDVNAYGQMIGNWVVADSDGKANVLLQEVNDFPILKDYVTGFKAAVSAGCPDCKITELNNTIAQLGGQIVPTIIAALQKDPSINYVSSVNGPFLTGLPAALSAAGLSNIKMSGESGDATNLTNVKAGKEQAYTGLATHHAAWLMVDMVLRNLQGMDYDKDGDGGAPKQLLTQDVTFDVSGSYDKPADFAGQFKKLWLVP